VELYSSSAFKIYAAVSAVLMLKLAAIALVQGALRAMKGPVTNPEDARLMGNEVGPDSPFVARLGRVLRNNMESEVPFVLLGLMYAAVNPPMWGMQVYAYTFLAARLAHNGVYLAGLQPVRTAFWILGTLCVVGLSVQVLLGAFA